MIRAILFDLDETLLDQQGASMAALKLFGKREIPHIPWGVVEERWNGCLKNHFGRYERGEITFQEQRRCRIRDIFANPEMPDEEADRLFGIYLEEYAGGYRLFPEVRTVLEQIGRYPLGVVSNGNSEQQHDKLRRMGIGHLFRTIVISEAVGLRKPDPRIFEMAAHGLGVAPEGCLFVGDNLEADYRGSLKAGMQAVLVNRRSLAFGEDVRQIVDLTGVVKLLGPGGGHGNG